MYDMLYLYISASLYEASYSNDSVKAFYILAIVAKSAIHGCLVAKGIAEGEAAIIINMHNNGLSAEQIASFTNKDIHEVERIIENATSHTHKN